MERAADILHCETKGAVARLTMNRPKARNSPSLALLERLHSAIDALSNDPSIHVIILAGNGPGFCAGHDLKEMTAARASDDGGKAFFNKTMAACSQLMQSIVTCPKPVIAEVHGIATAAGCQLVASCDLAVASGAAQIDEVAKQAFGVPIGPFAVMNIVKPRINLAAVRTLAHLGSFYAPSESLIACGDADEAWPLDKNPAPLDGAAQDMIAKRLQGAVFLAVKDELAEQVASAEAIDLGATKAFAFQTGPVAMMNALGTEAVAQRIALVCEPDHCGR